MSEIILLRDYHNNKEICLCGSKRFFSTTKNGKTDKLQCGECETIYLRNYKKNQFEKQ